jgi:hypothetical protein
MTTIGRNDETLRVPVGSDALSRNGGAFPNITNNKPVLWQNPLSVRLVTKVPQTRETNVEGKTAG